MELKIGEGKGHVKVGTKRGEERVRRWCRRKEIY